MKLYVYTANGPQRNRCGEIGLPAGEKLLVKSKLDVYISLLEIEKSNSSYYK